MKATTVALGVGFMLVGGVTMAQRSIVQPASRGPTIGTVLTPVGQQREAAYTKALEDTKGRITKADYAKYVGTTDPAYVKATTHMPAGVGFTVPVTGAAQVAKARSNASAYAVDQAERMWRAHSSTPPTRAEAERLVQQQDQEIASINAQLALRSDTLRQLSEKGDSAGIAQQVNQVIHQRAETFAKRKLVGAPESLSETERQQAKERYTTLMNRQRTVSGGKP